MPLTLLSLHSLHSHVSGGLPYGVIRIQVDFINLLRLSIVENPDWKLEHHLRVLQRNPLTPQGISTRTLRTWYESTVDYGVVPALAKRIGIHSSRRTSSRTKFTSEIGVELLSIFTTDPTLYIYEVNAILRETTGVTISDRTLTRWIHTKLNMSRQVVQRKACQRVEANRVAFQLRLKNLVREPSDLDCLIMLDETNKDRNSALRKHGWGRVGQSVQVSEAFNTDTRYTYIALADINGFVIELGRIFEHSVQGKKVYDPLNKEEFTEFFRHFVYPRLGSYARREKWSILIMDNCTIHGSPEIMDMVREKGAIIVFSPPFSPDLIPIEFAFATYKGGIKKFNNKTIAAQENIDCKDYMAIHLKAAALVTPGMMANYFRHLITWDDELLSNHPNSAAYQQQLLIAAVVTVVLDAL